MGDMNSKEHEDRFDKWYSESLDEQFLLLDFVKDTLLNIEKFKEANKYFKVYNGDQSPLIETIDFQNHRITKYPSIIYNSIFIATYSLIEHSMLTFSRLCQEIKHSKVSMNDLKGNFLDSFKKYFEKVLNVEIVIDKDLWNTFSQIAEVRNCLVHHRGSMEHFGNKVKIEQLVLKNNHFVIKDSTLVLNIGSCHEAALIGGTFLQSLYQQRKKFF